MWERAGEYTELVVENVDYLIRDTSDHVTHFTSTLCVCHVIRSITHCLPSSSGVREQGEEDTEMRWIIFTKSSELCLSWV